MSQKRRYSEQICRVCGESFIPTSGKQWRCSACISIEARPEPTPLCACGCGEQVRWSRSLKGWRKFVHGHAVRVAETPPAKGHIPWNRGRKTRYKHTCKVCNKKFENTFKKANFCSKRCYHNRQKGKNHPGWKGGSTLYWTKKARQRDKYTCQIPGCGFKGKGKKTHAHHIIPVAVGGKNTLSNLITLCRKHHREIELALFDYLVKMFPEEVIRWAKRSKKSRFRCFV